MYGQPPQEIPAWSILPRYIRFNKQTRPLYQDAAGPGATGSYPKLHQDTPMIRSMTAFGNARLDGRPTLHLTDLPEGGSRRTPIGFAN